MICDARNGQQMKLPKQQDTYQSSLNRGIPICKCVCIYTEAQPYADVRTVCLYAGVYIHVCAHLMYLSAHMSQGTMYLYLDPPIICEYYLYLHVIPPTYMRELSQPHSTLSIGIPFPSWSFKYICRYT